MTGTPGLLTIKEAAAQLGLSQKYLYKLVSDKKIDFVRLGTAIRFNPADLDQWIADRTVPAVK